MKLRKSMKTTLTWYKFNVVDQSIFQGIYTREWFMIKLLPIYLSLYKKLFSQDKLIDLVEEMRVINHDNQAIMYSMLFSLEESIEKKLTDLTVEISEKLHSLSLHKPAS